jgi:hypothetical protein
MISASSIPGTKLFKRGAFMEGMLALMATILGHTAYKYPDAELRRARQKISSEAARGIENDARHRLKD